MRGRFSTSRVPMTWPRELVSVSNWVGSAVTVTDSFTDPAFMRRSTRWRAFTSTVKVGVWVGTKLDASTFTWYEPMGTEENSYLPSRSVVAVCEI